MDPSPPSRVPGQLSIEGYKPDAQAKEIASPTSLALQACECPTQHSSAEKALIKPRQRPPYEAALLVVLVMGMYFTRISDPPLLGEEPRWACGAEEMLRTGDWIVPRQQGRVFPERPPLGSWCMAAVSLICGTEVDVFAIRLPSLLAVLFTSLLIQAYAGTFLSRWGAFAAGLVYASFGHVLQIGRLGESDALFTFFLGGSLLVWHLGYTRRWPALATWCAGYGLAALAALVKGPQAPAYFVAATGAYLVLRRDWSFLLNWRHAVGLGLFAAIVGAWQVPFYLATDWASVQALWGGLAGDRFVWSRLPAHMVAYPLEILVCLLPWSPLLLGFAHRQVRQSLGEAKPMVVFAVTAIVVTFPSVLFASLARGRYFMPLFPCFAVLIGLILDRLSLETSSRLSQVGWRFMLRAFAAVAAVIGLIVVVATFTSVESIARLQQPVWFAVVFAAGGCLTAGVLIWAAGQCSPRRVPAAVVGLALFGALLRVGFVTNIEMARNNPVEEHVRVAKAQLPETEKLVSLGPVDHRFVYFFREPIDELDWPTQASQIPADVTYFCMNRYPCDTPQWRADGRGRTSRSVPGTLPVKWETVAVIPVQRRLNIEPQLKVVIGKIIRPVPRSSGNSDQNSPPPVRQAERPTTPRRSS